MCYYSVQTCLRLADSTAANQSEAMLQLNFYTKAKLIHGRISAIDNKAEPVVNLCFRTILDSNMFSVTALATLRECGDSALRDLELS